MSDLWKGDEDPIIRYVVYKEGKILPSFKSYRLTDACRWIRQWPNHNTTYKVVAVSTRYVYRVDGMNVSRIE